MPGIKVLLMLQLELNKNNISLTFWQNVSFFFPLCAYSYYISFLELLSNLHANSITQVFTITVLTVLIFSSTSTFFNPNDPPV